ncbi:Crp/Fnr family transcriptional regulator [Chitinophaga horti]|uniref:Crp/Fnr family transcriptional regulator n=1 Tax=Chitinophaga horti TaxID=2920382 RepID=A0ABY6IY64_9BACT|nr:Crp/Fnr family transcriptional regulator [Chitinophaga horti]UYQ90954.1 Crp/Fnr family transcriptional regulator [Chitinophaga horti]
MSEHLLFTTLQQRHHFPTTEFEKFLALFEEAYLPKNDMLFTTGSIVKQVCFLMKGCMRQYHITANGDERNIFFAEEGWWCGEMDSFINLTPSTMSMQAVEDCHILCMDREKWEHATRTIPDYALYQIKNRGYTVAWLKGMLSNISVETPDEKYRRILKETPHWINRLPQYQIASYLGVTPETLSRIRKRNMRL